MSILVSFDVIGQMERVDGAVCGPVLCNHVSSMPCVVHSTSNDVHMQGEN